MSENCSEEWSLKKDRRNPFDEIEIYADEIVLPWDFNNHKRNFIGIGCLFVPLPKKNNLLSRLLNSRCLYKTNNVWVWDYKLCPFSTSMEGRCKEQWHEQNMCEIHHTNLRSSRSSNSQKEISRNWINYLLENNKERYNEVYFNILFIDLDILEIDRFGTEKVHENIYNRFFRTAIIYGIKAFFSNKKVIIKKIYHDKGNMERHDYFPYLNLKRLDNELDSKVMVEDTDIAFIDSDHRNYLNQKNELVEASQLIQFIDLLIGSITQNIYYLSDDVLKKEMAMQLRPLVERLLEKPSNTKSSYNYFGRQHISFYPKYYIENSIKYLSTFNLEEIQKDRTDMFHTDKKIEMLPYDPKQKNLFDF